MFKKRVLFVLLTSLFLLSVPVASIAATFKADSDVTIGKDEVVDGDLYISGSSINIEGFVKGDLFTAGQTIDIDHEVSGDFWAAGSNINIRSTVWDDVRVAGSQIILDAGVGSDVFAAGATIECTTKSLISGSAFLSGGDVKILGDIKGDLNVSANTVTIEGTITGNVKATIGDKLTLGKSARIGGNLEYTSAKEVEKAEGAVVSGETTRHETADGKSVAWLGGIALTSGYFLWKFVWWLASLLLLLVLIWLAPTFSVSVGDYLSKNPWKSLGFGLLGLIFIPVIGVVLCVLILGLPIGVVMLLSYVILIMFAKALFGLWFGRKIFQLFNKNKRGYKPNLVWAAIVGTLVATILFMLPFIGWLFKWVALWLTFGALIIIIWDLLKHFKRKGAV